MKVGWAALVGLVAIAGCSGELGEVEPARPALSGLRYLSDGSEAGFARAVAPREFVFPRDHGGHPEFRTEWWYFTGNLATADGRHFGFELTFFRYALQPPGPALDNGSAWRTEQIFLAHLAVTDTAGGRFRAHERFARGALGLAGASAAPVRIWVGDWSAEGEDVDGSLALRLEAQADDVGLRLDLRSTRPAVLQGERGLDRKGSGPGNASYYYSVPGLATTGEVRVGASAFAVEGRAWMDREWGTSAVEPGVVGWDWFALELGDGTSLMFYRLRQEDGTASPFSAGTWATAGGRTQRLAAEDVVLTAKRHWRSSATGVTYPVEWRLELPTLELSLEIEPVLDDQEVDLSVRYWEGAVRARGSLGGRPIGGQGYVELAGY